MKRLREKNTHGNKTLKKKIQLMLWLPVEIVGSIFDRIQHFKNVIHFSTVNKTWYQAAQNTISSYLSAHMPFFKVMREQEYKDNSLRLLSSEINFYQKDLTYTNQDYRGEVTYVPHADHIIAALKSDMQLIDIERNNEKVQEHYYSKNDNAQKIEKGTMSSVLKSKLQALAVAHDFQQKIPSYEYPDTGAFRMELARFCAFNGNIEGLQKSKFLDNYAIACKSNFANELISSATARGHFEIVKYLIRLMKGNNLTIDKDFDKLLAPVILSQDINAITTLLNEVYPCSPDIVDQIFNLAVTKNKLEVVKEFLQRDQISIDTLEETLENGISDDAKTLIMSFVEYADMPDELEETQALELSYVPGFHRIAMPQVTSKVESEIINQPLVNASRLN